MVQHLRWCAREPLPADDDDALPDDGTEDDFDPFDDEEQEEVRELAETTGPWIMFEGEGLKRYGEGGFDMNNKFHRRQMMHEVGTDPHFKNEDPELDDPLVYKYGLRDLESRGVLNWAVDRQRLKEDDRLQPLWTLSDGVASEKAYSSIP